MSSAASAALATSRGARALRLDLLCATPRPTAQLEALERAVELAFVSGGGAPELASRLATPRRPPSHFEPRSFAADVFLEELLAGLAEGSGARVSKGALDVLALPSTPEDARRRQQVFRELEQRPQLEVELRAGVVALQQLLVELCPGGVDYDPGARRADTLRAVRTVIEALSGGFESATSALGELRAYAREIAESQPYRRLLDLLDYEERAVGVELRLGVGRDGRLRQVQLLELEPNQHSAFYVSPLRRLWQRLLLLWRGAPLRATELVYRTFDEVFAGLVAPVTALLVVLADLEVYLAGQGLRGRAAQAGLETCLAELQAEPSCFEALWNPHLLVAGVRPVATDVCFEPGAYGVVLSGPNSGGKTRALQAVALAQLLGQAGFPVPARSARLRWASSLVVSMREPGSADHCEGRLGAELLRVREVFERAKPGVFVVLDELCSGTNPSEAEEIFRLVLELLELLEPQVLVSTHLLDFITRFQAEQPRGLTFFQVELDAERRPTYRVVPGVATTSLARETAARLGVTRAELTALVERARHPGASQSP